MNITKLDLSKSVQQNVSIRKSTKFNLQLSPDKKLLLNVITSEKKATKNYIQINVTYFDPKQEKHSKIVYAKIGAIAKLLKVKKKKVENYFKKNKLEQKLAKRLKYEPTTVEFGKLKKLIPKLSDKDLIGLIRICKKLKNSPEIVRREYGIELPPNWEDNGVSISNQNLPCKLFIDPFGEIYILKKGDEKGAISLKGEYITDLKTTISIKNRKKIGPLWNKSKLSDEQVSLLMKETGLQEDKARFLLTFAKVYKDKPKELLRNLNVSTKKTENIYLGKQPPLARSIFIGPSREIYIMKEGEEYEGFSVEKNAIFNLEKAIKKSKLEEKIKNKAILSELQKNLKPSNDQISLLLKKETGLTRGEVVELLTFANIYKKNPEVLFRNMNMSTKQTSNIYIKKTDSNLPRSIFIDKECRIWFLLKGEKVGIGGEKKITCAISPEGLLVANTVPKYSLRDEALRIAYDEEMYNDIENEIYEKISRGNSRYLVKAFAFGPVYESRHGKKVLMISEYCEEGCLTLEKFMKMTDKQRLKFFLNTMKGGKCLHDMGFSHNDYEPQNILIKKSEPRIMDFGTSQSFEDLENEPDSLKFGTPQYSSPESLLMDFDLKKRFNVFKKSDVWSIGVTFYTLFNQLEEPPWTARWITEWRSDLEIKPTQVQRLTCFASRYKDILSKDNPTQSDLGIKEPTDPLNLVLYKMLHPNPEKRISLNDAIKELKKAIKAR